MPEEYTRALDQVKRAQKLPRKTRGSESPLGHWKVNDMQASRQANAKSGNVNTLNCSINNQG